MILAVVSSSIILSVSLSSPDRSIPLQVKTEYQGVDAVVHAFDRHSIVLLGEVHWSNAEHRFIQKLLRDTRFPCLVDDIAIEAGNSLYQPLIDRFVAGDAVPADSIQLAWRNTTQPMAWDPPVYGAIYRLEFGQIRSRFPAHLGLSRPRLVHDAREGSAFEAPKGSRYRRRTPHSPAGSTRLHAAVVRSSRTWRCAGSAI